MSFLDRAILWLHIGVAIFTIGPATAAIMSTPRYIRRRDVAIVGFLLRITRVYAIASLLVFVFGIVLASSRGEIAKPWVSISMTLFVVAGVLMYLITRDQSSAVGALQRAAASASKSVVPASAPAVPAAAATEVPEAAQDAKDGEAGGDGSRAGGSGGAGNGVPAGDTAGAESVNAGDREATGIADVERGRIVSLGGITSLIWIVILILMVWQ